MKKILFILLFPLLVNAQIQFNIGVIATDSSYTDSVFSSDFIVLTTIPNEIPVFSKGINSRSINATKVYYRNKKYVANSPITHSQPHFSQGIICDSIYVDTLYYSYSGIPIPPTYIPTVITTAISNITTTTADGGGNVTDTGSTNVTIRGICWSTNVNPTIADDSTKNGAGIGVFTSELTGLTAGTLYHRRAYAINSIGVGYGADSSFTTTGGTWKPTDVAGCLYWVNADSALYDGSFYVDSLLDMSGNNYDAIQNTAASQSLWIADGGVGLNNKPVIRFDGNNDFLISNITASYSQPITVFIAWSENAVTEQYPFSTGFNNICFQYYPNTNFTLTPQSGGVTYKRDAPVSLINTGVWNGASSKIYENGHLMATGTPYASALTGNLYLGQEGTGGYFNGDLAEIIVYDGLLSGSDFTLVENYLEDKYKPYINEVPLMTSATTPSGVVTVSNENVGYEGWKVFDGAGYDPAYLSCWYYASYPQWVKYEFPTTKTIKGYRLHGGSVADGIITAWTLEGSNDDITYDLLDTQTGQDVTTMKLYTIANTTAYIYYKLTVTAGGIHQFVLYQLELDSN